MDDTENEDTPDLILQTALVEELRSAGLLLQELTRLEDYIDFDTGESLGLNCEFCGAPESEEAPGQWHWTPYAKAVCARRECLLLLGSSRYA